MSKGVKGVYIFTWILVVISTFFQFFGIAGTTDLFGIFGQETEINFLSIWVLATILLPVSAVLCGVLSKKDKWYMLPIILSLVTAALSLMVVFSMAGVEEYQDRFNAVSMFGNSGVTGFTLIYRHGLPVLVGVMLALITRRNYHNVREDRIRAEEEAYKEHYLLDGDPLFKDEDSTLGLTEYAEDFSVEKKPRKLKKSQRIAKAKLLEKKAKKEKK